MSTWGGDTVLELLVLECTMAFVVLCADAVDDGGTRSVGVRVFRAICWPPTIAMWCARRSMRKLARFGAVVWFLVTCGWLLSLEQDRAPSDAWFPLIAEVTLAFVVGCVDAMVADLQHRPLLRAVRAVLWPIAVVEYLSEDDGIHVVYASLVVWLMLTCGWLLTMQHDRFFASVVPMFGLGLAR